MGSLKKENNSCLRSPPLHTSVLHMKHSTNNDVGGFQTKESTLWKQTKSCQVLSYFNGLKWNSEIEEWFAWAR